MKRVTHNNNHYIYTSLSRHGGFEDIFRNFYAAAGNKTVSTLPNESEKVRMDHRFFCSDRN